MFELSLHILDLVQNAISAGAKLVKIIIHIDMRENILTISITDDGCGMDEALLRRVTSPFATTRTTRKVGLGIPMFKQLAEMCAGSFLIESTLGVGTRLTASFMLNHMDLPPLGDISDTMLTLVIGAPDSPELCMEYSRNENGFTFDTREIRQALGGVPLNMPEVIAWMGGYLREGIAEVDRANVQQD